MYLEEGVELIPGLCDENLQLLKKDLHLSSICGGTDLVSCFVCSKNPDFLGGWDKQMCC